MPIDTLFNPCDTSSSDPSVDYSFYLAVNGFVVPAVGQQATMNVQNGANFAVGQWIQFVNPAGTFRIMSITGNVLSLLNAASDGITAITGNPVPPYQYPYNAQFVVVSQPTQLTQAQYNSIVQQSLEEIESICLHQIPEKTDSEQVFLLGYLKSSVCQDEEGCLRKMQPDGPYIDENGNTVFQQPISAPAVNIPVPVGGIPPNNLANLNPNNGTGGGFLTPFVNPLTGETTYINLFSGITNGGAYAFYLNSAGQLVLTDQIGKHEVYWPEKVIHEVNGIAYSGFGPVDVNVSTYTGSPLPDWAKFAKVRFSCILYSDVATRWIRFSLNNQSVAGRSVSTTFRASFEETIIVPLTNGQFRLQIAVFADKDGNTSGTVTLGSGDGIANGQIKVSIVEILS